MVRSILQYWVSIVLYIITAGSVNVGGGCHTQMVGLTWPHRVLWLSNGGWSLAPRKAFEGLGNPIHQGFCPRSCQMPPHFPHNPNHISPNVGYNVITHILGTRVRKTSGGPHLPILSSLNTSSCRFTFQFICDQSLDFVLFRKQVNPGMLRKISMMEKCQSPGKWDCPCPKCMRRSSPAMPKVTKIPAHANQGQTCTTTVQGLVIARGNITHT